MAKGAYIGVTNSSITNKALKIKKIYIGVGGIAKRVKKAYIGDANGIARLWWRGETVLQQNLNCDYLTYGVDEMASANTKDRMIFAGGSGTAGATGLVNGKSKNVYSYNSSFTMTKLTDLTGEAEYLGGAPFNGFAVFAGGSYSVYNATPTLVTSYNNSGTKASHTAMTERRLLHPAVASNDSYLFIAGGAHVNGEDYEANSLAEIYNTSFTKQSSLDFSLGRYAMGARTKRYAILGSGTAFYPFSTTMTIGERITITKSHNSDWHQGVSFNDSAFFYDNRSSSTNQVRKYINGIDDLLTEFISLEFNEEKTGRGGGNTNYHMIYAGGGSPGISTVYCYNESYTLSYLEDLPEAYYNAAACGIEEKIVIAGGYPDSVTDTGKIVIGYEEK